MTIKEFFVKIQEISGENIYIAYTNVGDLRTAIYNTHILNLNEELKKCRCELLVMWDELYGIDIL